MSKTTIINKYHVLCGLLFAATMTALRAGPVSLVGSERIVFHLRNDATYPCGYVGGTTPAGTPAPTDDGIHTYKVSNSPFLDGPIAPISYSVGGGAKKLRFNVSVGFRNYELTSNLTGSGATASFDNPVFDCNPVYQAQLSGYNNTFGWAEWLYGTFRDATSGEVYSVLYNEYYGGNYPGSPPTYAALGIATSTNNGATFQKILPAPSHVMLEAPYLWPSGGGFGFFGGIFKSPLDQFYYVGASGGNVGTPLLRTSNLNDPTTWRAWDGNGFNLPTTPLNSGYVGISVNPLYLGYSDYFKKYIAVTVGQDSSQKDIFVYNLSDDLLHWGLNRTLIYNPGCAPSYICGNTGTPTGYPALMDPVYLSNTSDSTQSSNGITGMQPYVTYTKNSVSLPDRQQLAAQQVSFANIVFNRMDSFSIRGVVDTGNRFMVLGMIVQGSESKQFVFRGLGPSLGIISGYTDISNPRITLYGSSGNQLATNTGWTTLSTADQDTLRSFGIQPGNTSESAIVITLAPGNYTVAMDGGTGVGLIDAYDLSSTAESKVAQISERGYSQPGNGALILGFFSRGGQQPVIRGTGTSTLAPAGFSPVIPNPNITVSGAVSKYNDNWGDNNSTDLATINNNGLAPGNSLESATTFTTQTPTFNSMTTNSVFTTYTVQLQGTGFGLIDLYNVNSN